MFMTRSIMLYFVIQLLFVTILLSLKIRARTQVLSIIAIPVPKAVSRTLWTLNNICWIKVKWPSWRDELQKQLKNMMVCFVMHICFLQFSSVQLLSLVQLFVTPMNHSTPGLPVHHQLPESTQTHVHRVGDAIQPSHCNKHTHGPTSTEINIGLYDNLPWKRIYTQLNICWMNKCINEGMNLTTSQNLFFLLEIWKPTPAPKK